MSLSPTFSSEAAALHKERKLLLRLSAGNPPGVYSDWRAEAPQNTKQIQTNLLPCKQLFTVKPAPSGHKSHYICMRGKDNRTGCKNTVIYCKVTNNILVQRINSVHINIKTYIVTGMKTSECSVSLAVVSFSWPLPQCGVSSYTTRCYTWCRVVGTRWMIYDFGVKFTFVRRLLRVSKECG